METRKRWLYLSMSVLALLLSVCGGGKTVVDNVVDTATQPPGVATQAPTFDVEDLDAAFKVFLADMEQYNTISPEELNTLLANTSPFLLDLRDSDAIKANGHIAGAVPIPLRALAQNIAYLPSFDTQIVCYAKTIQRCSIALTVLEALGWKDVKVLKEIGETDSFPAWIGDGYPVVAGAPPAAEMLNAVDIDGSKLAYFDTVLSNIPERYGAWSGETINEALNEGQDLILIDVRLQDESQQRGVIDAPNTLHIPLEQIIDLKDMWPTDKNAKILFYDRSGHRSTIAMTILWSYGYTDPRSLVNGFTGWESDGYPVRDYVMP